METASSTPRGVQAPRGFAENLEGESAFPGKSDEDKRRDPGRRPKKYPKNGILDCWVMLSLPIDRDFQAAIREVVAIVGAAKILGNAGQRNRRLLKAKVTVGKTIQRDGSAARWCDEEFRGMA